MEDVEGRILVGQLHRNNFVEQRGALEQVDLRLVLEVTTLQGALEAHLVPRRVLEILTEHKRLQELGTVALESCANDEFCGDIRSVRCAAGCA